MKKIWLFLKKTWVLKKKSEFKKRHEFWKKTLSFEKIWVLKKLELLQRKNYRSENKTPNLKIIRFTIQMSEINSWVFMSLMGHRTFKHIKLGKSGYSRRLSQQRWGLLRAHPPSGRWKWSKREGNCRDGKMFSNFLVVVRREALCLAFMSYKHTRDVQDGRNAPSLVAG